MSHITVSDKSAAAYRARRAAESRVATAEMRSTLDSLPDVVASFTRYRVEACVVAIATVAFVFGLTWLGVI